MMMMMMMMMMMGAGIFVVPLIYFFGREISQPSILTYIFVFEYSIVQSELIIS